MSFAIGRHDLVALAEAKLLDAALLLGHERFGNAYYLAGYAVEIGLKAAISRQFAADTLPDPKFVRTLYTHSVKELVSAAGLVPALKARQDESPTFSSHWTVVSAWTEEARYRSVDATTARMMVEPSRPIPKECCHGCGCTGRTERRGDVASPVLARRGRSARAGGALGLRP